MIPIYVREENVQKKRIPALSIEENSDGTLLVVVVNPDTGEIIADLGQIQGKGSKSFTSANQAVKIRGFSTDWAEWDADGRFVMFK